MKNQNLIISGAKMTYPKSTLHTLFEERASLFPNSTAIEFEDTIVTYGELRKMTNQMANYLWDQGLRPGQIVAVSLDRSPNLIASLFAIMQCGAAYIPLDPKFPVARLEFMFEDSEASFLITTKFFSTSLFHNQKTILLEDILATLDQHPIVPLTVYISHEAVAYILYTSGSTGQPKGVAVTHKNLVNFLFSMALEPGIKEDDKLLSITTISFDIAGLEIFLPLINGATVVIADHETARDGQLLLNLLQKKKITILQATPTTWQILLDSGWEEPIALKALCGGEALPFNLARQLTSRCDSLWNMYGPTETTIWSTIKQIHADDDLITIGRPIENTQIYILNEDGQIVETGSIGEIVIGGDGVAQGYWKRPELTAEKFILDSFSTEPNSILYRTGDLGKLLPNQEFLCLGRIDHQVKIRGHRIELGEVEAALNSISGIKQSAVIANTDFGNETRIVAYLKSTDQLEDEGLIQIELSKLLPEISLPSFYVWIDEFPITPNGKIDKKSLPKTKFNRPNFAPKYRKPTTKIEEEIVKIWSDLLEIPVIGIDDNFFEMGGTSLTLTQLGIKLKKKFKIHITFRQLIEKFATPSLLAEYYSKNIVKEEYNSIFPTKPNEELRKIEELVEHSKTVETTLNSYQSDVNNYNIKNNPPVEGAKLGRDKEGNPAWFIENPNKAGEYIKINI